MKMCPLCRKYFDNINTRCPIDGTSLPSNEVSSEDGDDGDFVEDKGEKDADDV